MSPNPHCRIGRVRWKGAPNVVVINGGGHQPREDKLVSYARSTAKSMAGDLAGFIIIAWGDLGAYSVSADITASFIPTNLLPAWTEEVVRREFVTSKVARDIINREYVVK